MMPSRLFAPLLVALIVVANALPASAFVRTRVPYDREFPEMKPLYWPKWSVTYVTHDEGSDDVSLQEAVTAVSASFASWGDLTCTELELRNGGLTPSVTTGWLDGPNAINTNLVIWRERECEGFVPTNDACWDDDSCVNLYNCWDASYPEGVLAMTTPSFYMANGKIIDADIEMNGSVTWSVDGSVGYDIQNVLTHEVGHFIGLDHSPLRDATMFASASLGELSKRDLSQDDIDGYCSIYVPRDEGGGGCSTTGVGLSGLPLWLGLGLAALTRRRRGSAAG